MAIPSAARTMWHGAWTGALLGAAAAIACVLLIALPITAASSNRSPLGLVVTWVAVVLLGVVIGVPVGCVLGTACGLVIGALATVLDESLPVAAALVGIGSWEAMTWLSLNPVVGGLRSVPISPAVAVPVVLGTAAAVLHAVRLRWWRRDAAAPRPVAPGSTP